MWRPTIDAQRTNSDFAAVVFALNTKFHRNVFQTEKAIHTEWEEPVHAELQQFYFDFNFRWKRVKSLIERKR